MKNILLIAGIFFSLNVSAQLNSSNLNPPASAQPVPNATATEKAAAPQTPIITPTPNPVPPIYPGGEATNVELPRQLVYPPSSPSPTQPVQTEPVSPIESTNPLQPNRPQREQPSRNNPVIAAPPANNTLNTGVIKTATTKSVVKNESVKTVQVNKPVVKKTTKTKSTTSKNK